MNAKQTHLIIFTLCCGEVQYIFKTSNPNLFLNPTQHDKAMAQELVCRYIRAVNAEGDEYSMIEHEMVDWDEIVVTGAIENLEEVL